MNILRAIAVFGCFAFLVAFENVFAGEIDTTWRAGDRVSYGIGCKDEAGMLQVLKDRKTVKNPYAGGYTLPSDCFIVLTRRGGQQIPSRMNAVLQEWISGPHVTPDGEPGSIWRVLDTDGDMVFIFGADVGGPRTPLMGVRYNQEEAMYQYLRENLPKGSAERQAFTGNW